MGLKHTTWWRHCHSERFLTMGVLARGNNVLITEWLVSKMITFSKFPNIDEGIWLVFNQESIHVYPGHYTVIITGHTIWVLTRYSWYIRVVIHCIVLYHAYSSIVLLDNTSLGNSKYLLVIGKYTLFPQRSGSINIRVINGYYYDMKISKSDYLVESTIH